MAIFITTATVQSAQPATNAPSVDLVFREPFTLTLQVDKEHRYEARFDRKIPYVADNDVYLFSGESFGLTLSITNGEIAKLSYQKEKNGADIELEFKQELQTGKDPMMLLILKSNIKHTLYLDAMMTRPEKDGVYNTSILPLQPGLSGYESWPHPIVQLVLTNLRLKKTAPNKGLQDIGAKARLQPEP